MAKTITTYALNGSNREFTIPFEYLARKFIKVTLVGTSRTELKVLDDYRFTQKDQITLSRAWGPADGYELVEIKRLTSATDRLVNFSDGSILRAYDLNISQIQAIHIAEEGRDEAEGSMSTDGLTWDALGLPIRNVGEPTRPGDAVNMSFMESSLARAIRAPEGETFEDLPRASSRSNRMLGFDAEGKLTIVVPTSGSAAELTMRLADKAEGAVLVAGALRHIGSIAELKGTRGRYDGDTVTLISYYAGWAATAYGSTGSGVFSFRASSDINVDDGYCVSAPNGKWVRLKVNNALDFGALPDNTLDCYDLTIRYMKYAYSRDDVREVTFPAGRFKFSNEIVFDDMPFTKLQNKHHFKFSGAGMEMTRLTFTGGNMGRLRFDFRARGGKATDIIRLFWSGFTLQDTRTVTPAIFAPGAGLHMIGCPDSRVDDIFVIGFNDGYIGNVVFGSNFWKFHTKYCLRGATFSGAPLPGTDFDMTDTASPINMDECEIQGTAQSTTGGWGIKVSKMISFHFHHGRFENWINAPCIIFEAARGCSLTFSYIEGSYATHAVVLRGFGTLDKESDLTQSVLIENCRFWESLGIVFYPGAINNKVGSNYWHQRPLGLSPLPDRLTNIHVTGVTGQLGVILYGNEVDLTNTTTDAYEPTEWLSDARFGMFLRSGNYAARKRIFEAGWDNTYPTTLIMGAMIIPSNFAVDGGFFGYVEAPGTKGSINGGVTTASTVAGSDKVTVTSHVDIYPTTFITIEGAFKRARVLEVDRSTNTVLVDAKASAKVSGISIKYEPPVLRKLV